MNAACSRLPTLTADQLTSAEQKWSTHNAVAYNLAIEMSGDRVEEGRFDVEVRAGNVVSFRRNGLVMQPAAGSGYTMEGLFRMLKQEIGLAEKPTMLGAPPGYSVYLSAQFDEKTGRLVHYRRTVGGGNNSIEIRVVAYGEN